LTELEPKLAPGDLLLGSLFAMPSVDAPAESARVVRASHSGTWFETPQETESMAIVAGSSTPSAQADFHRSADGTAPQSAATTTADAPVTIAGFRSPPIRPSHAAANPIPQSLLGVAVQPRGALPTGKMSLDVGNREILPTVASLPPTVMRPGAADVGGRAQSGSDSANSIVLDPIGNSYITGSYWNGQDTDVFVSKVSSTGTVLFTTVVPNAGRDSGNAIAIDTRGNAFVAGSRKSPGGDIDAFVAKFTRTGALFQMTTIVNPGPDSGNGIAIGAGNNGFMTGSFWSGTDSDFFISRFSATTNISCSFIYPNPGTDSGHAVALDSSSNAYVTGTFDFVVESYLYWAKFDTACDLLNGTFIQNSGPNAGNGIAVNASGEGYVTGSYWNGTDLDFIIARVDAAGAFPHSFVYPNPGDDRGNAVVFDAAFNAYVTGAFSFGTDVYVYVAIFDPTTTLVNGGYIFHVGEDRGMDIALGSGGTSRVVGAFDNGNHTDAFVAEFDAALMLTYQTIIPNSN
jgi:hypothetical protein